MWETVRSKNLLKRTDPRDAQPVDEGRRGVSSLRDSFASYEDELGKDRRRFGMLINGIANHLQQTLGREATVDDLLACSRPAPDSDFLLDPKGQKISIVGCRSTTLNKLEYALARTGRHLK